MKVITIKINEDTLELLDMYAIMLRKYRSDLIREAIKLYLDHLQKEKPLKIKVTKGNKLI